MCGFNDPMAVVRQYVDAFNNGDAKAMAAACADPMQILDGMSPHVWQGPTAAEDWWTELAEGRHLATSGYHITLGEPRQVDLARDYGYVVVTARMTFHLRGNPVAQTGAFFTVALRKADTGVASSGLGLGQRRTGRLETHTAASTRDPKWAPLGSRGTAVGDGVPVDDAQLEVSLVYRARQLEPNGEIVHWAWGTGWRVRASIGASSGSEARSRGYSAGRQVIPVC
jgi:ketosteroid isomerase-like protein